MNQVLSEAEIHQLLKKVKESNYVAKWPSLEDKKILLKALKEKKETVELEAGQFTIRYNEGIKYKFIDGVHSTAFVNPIKGFIPCGWFDEDHLRRDLEGSV